jgi:uncharacterized protein (DUF2267 family)
MRNLNFEDTFAFSEIIDKLDLNEDLNALFDEAQKHPDKQAFLGGQFVLKIARRWHMAKDEIIRFVASVVEKTPDEVKKMKFTEISEVLKAVITSEDIQAFILSLQGERK